MPKLALRIAMEPQEKQRHRVRLRGKTVQSYTPAETVQAEQRIAAEWLKAYGRQALTMWERDAPLRLTVYCFLTRPPSVKRPYPTVKPDASNYLKLCEDALNGIAWRDDGQVTDSRAIKRYAKPGQRPHIVIVLEDDGDVEQEMLPTQEQQKEFSKV